MFGLISKITDPIADTLTAASAVVSSTAKAAVTVINNGAAETGMQRTANTINNSLLALNETVKSVAFSAAISNDNDFETAKSQNPHLANYSSLDEYLASRM